MLVRVPYAVMDVYHPWEFHFATYICFVQSVEFDKELA